MRVVAFLAAFAKEDAGRLTVIDMASDVFPMGMPFALALVAFVDWNETPVQKRLEFELVDLDGNPVSVPPMGPLRAWVPIVASRVAGTPAGMTYQVARAMNFPPLPLPPGRYEFRFSIDGEAHTEATVPFTVTGG